MFLKALVIRIQRHHASRLEICLTEHRCESHEGGKGGQYAYPFKRGHYGIAGILLRSVRIPEVMYGI